MCVCVCVTLKGNMYIHTYRSAYILSLAVLFAFFFHHCFFPFRGFPQYFLPCMSILSVHSHLWLTFHCLILQDFCNRFSASLSFSFPWLFPPWLNHYCGLHVCFLHGLPFTGRFYLFPVWVFPPSPAPHHKLPLLVFPPPPTRLMFLSQDKQEYPKASDNT